MYARSGVVLPLLVLLVLASVSVYLGMASGNIVLPVALAYAVGFIILSWHRLDIALGFVLILAPWVQDVSGGGFAKFSAAELHIFMITLVQIAKAILARRVLTIGRLTGPVLLYTALMGVSAYQGGFEREDFIALFQTIIFCFVLPFLFMGSNLSDQNRRNMLLLSGCSIVVLGIVQIIAGPKAFALGIHKNNMGQGLAAGIALWMGVWFDGAKGWWSRITVPAIVICTVALVFSLSRGAWVGAICALVTLTIAYSRLQLLIRAIIIIVPLIGIMWKFMPQEHQQYAMSFDRQKYDNIDARYNNFERTLILIQQSPIIGHGISIRKLLDATNLVMVTLAEGGIIGFALFTWLLWTYFASAFRVLRYLPLTDSRYFLVAVSCSVMSSRLGHAQFDHYWVRGASTIAWATVGFVLAVEGTLLINRGKTPSVLPTASDGKRNLI